jgi:hypothetical protein
MPAIMSEDSYKVIMGRNNIINLRLIIDFKHGKLLWEELELNLQCNSLQSRELFDHSSSAVSAVESRVVRILDAEYKKSDLKDAVPSHLDVSQVSALYSLFTKYEAIFEGKLGNMPGSPCRIPISQDSKLFAS